MKNLITAICGAALFLGGVIGFVGAIIAASIKIELGPVVMGVFGIIGLVGLIKLLIVSFGSVGKKMDDLFSPPGEK